MKFIKQVKLVCITTALGTASAVGTDEQQRPLLQGHGGHRDRLVDSEALQDLIKPEILQARAEKLYDIARLGEPEYGHPTRVIGSAGHVGTLDYIYSSVATLGSYYEVWNQSFPAVTGNVFESHIVLGDAVLESASPMGLTPPTKDNKSVQGDLVLVHNEGCDASDYPAGLYRNIALILRGSCSFGTKSGLAGRAGALAAVVYNYDSDIVHGTLGTPSPDHVATWGLSGDEGKAFAKKLQEGERVKGVAYMDAVVNTIITKNILAQTTSDCDVDNVVMLGGHSDSVAEGPGINDDGSGSISLLEVAIQLSKFNVNNCVRFAWWAGEEEGLLGSDYYVSVLSPEENKKIRLFMDYDMMASPNFAYQVYDARDDVNPVGSQRLRDLYISWYDAHGLNHTTIAFDGRSDYDGFIRNGIPAGGIATGAEGIKTNKEEKLFGGNAGNWYDPCYHQLCDDVGNLNMTAWVVNTQLIAHSVATYALSLEGFPEREDDATATFSEDYVRSVKYHGHKLII